MPRFLSSAQNTTSFISFNSFRALESDFGRLCSIFGMSGMLFTISSLVFCRNSCTPVEGLYPCGSHVDFTLNFLSGGVGGGIPSSSVVAKKSCRIVERFSRLAAIKMSFLTPFFVSFTVGMKVWFSPRTRF